LGGVNLLRNVSGIIFIVPVPFVFVIDISIIILIILVMNGDTVRN
jgi:hypothetical protein